MLKTLPMPEIQGIIDNQKAADSPLPDNAVNHTSEVSADSCEVIFSELVGHVVNNLTKDPSKKSEMPPLWELMDNIVVPALLFKEQILKLSPMTHRVQMAVFMLELMKFKTAHIIS